MLYFPFELLAALFVFCIRLEKRERFSFRLLAAAFSVLLLAGILIMAEVLHYGNISLINAITVSVTLFMCVFLFLFMIFTVWLLFRVSWQEAVYCATCAYLTEHIAYCIRLLVNQAAGKSIAEGGSIWYFVVHFLVYLISYYAFANKMVQEKHYATTAVRSLGLMVCVLFLVMGMSILSSFYGFVWIHGIYALFSCIFVLYSQVNLQRQINLQEDLSIQRQLWMKHKAQYEMSKETIEIINMKCHDLKHQVAALRTINNPQAQKSAIDSIENSVMIYDAILKTGNVILDTVLTEKSLLCSKNHIKITCMADGKLLDFMDPVDVYTLFGNALDNAVEGVAALEQEERFINLLIQEKANLILIQLENRYKGEIEMKDGFLVTRKKEKAYHGFGVKSMITIVEKYHGFVKIETDHQVFLLRITIPVP